MAAKTFAYRLGTQGFSDVRDVTPQAREALERAGLKEGLLTVMVSGSTAGVTTLEWEPGAVADLRAALERIAPSKGDYAHDRAWGDGNGFSHLRAALLGPSVTVPFQEGRLALGTWQQIVLVDCDNRPRERNFVVQVLGEGWEG